MIFSNQDFLVFQIYSIIVIIIIIFFFNWFSKITKGLLTFVSKFRDYTITVFKLLKNHTHTHTHTHTPVSYTHLRAPRDKRQSRMPSSA